MRRGGGAPPRWVFMIAAFTAISGWLVSGFYSVPQGSRGVLLQFGRQAQVVRPGAHWRWPAPFASDRVVSVRQIHIVAIGYQRHPKLFEGVPAPVQASMLTANQDIVDLKFAVQYRVNNPSHYLFALDHPRKTVARVAEAIMRQHVATAPSDSLLRAHPRVIEMSTKSALQRVLNRYGAGIHIISVKIEKAVPPKPVMAALEKVARAREANRQQHNEARAYADSILPKAHADAATLLDKARAYRTTVVAQARGRASRFNALLKVYKAAPQVTRERLFIDALASVYRRAPKILLAGSSHAVIKVPLTRAFDFSPTQQSSPAVGKKR